MKTEPPTSAVGLLRRLRQWDHLDGAGDGPFWKAEIDRVLAMDDATTFDETDSTGKPTIESLLEANETLQKEIDSLRHRLRELTRIQSTSSGRY